MSGIINLIAQHSSKLNILPIIVVMNIIITILIHFLTERKIIKYIPSLLMGVISLIVLISALKIFTSPKGLNLSWIAVFLGTASLVGILFCFIVDLVQSLRNQTNVELNMSSDSKKKVNTRKISFKDGKNKTNRIARKNRNSISKNKNDSKYITRKISTKNIKAKKINDSLPSKKRTFEAE